MKIYQKVQKQYDKLLSHVNLEFILAVTYFVLLTAIKLDRILDLLVFEYSNVREVFRLFVNFSFLQNDSLHLLTLHSIGVITQLQQLNQLNYHLKRSLILF